MDSSVRFWSFSRVWEHDSAVFRISSLHFFKNDTGRPRLTDRYEDNAVTGRTAEKRKSNKTGEKMVNYPKGFAKVANSTINK